MHGNLDKMNVSLSSDNEAKYFLQLSDQRLALNALIGKKIRLTYLNEIHCTHCQKLTKKSYGGGYCYPCTLKLPECDLCILKPELCHFEKGTCRSREWGLEHCYIDHYVYLANSSGAKVGITRHTQVPTRFIDQGAICALPIMKVKSRHLSGQVEKLLAQEIKDKTDWRKMLKGANEEIDLEELRDHLFEIFESDLEKISSDGIEYLLDRPLIHIHYPVQNYPEKVTSLNLDKHPIIEDELWGIKGQYLIFKSGVINIRNHTGYKIQWETL